MTRNVSITSINPRYHKQLAEQFSRKIVAPPHRTETELQIAVAHFLELALAPHVYYTAIGHGGGGRVRGAILKAMGLKPGAPDLLFVRPSDGRACFIELKAKRGTTSDAQDKTHDDINLCGGLVSVCRSVEAVEICLRAWDFPMRATIK